MKKLSNTEAELKECVAYKKVCVLFYSQWKQTEWSHCFKDL